MFFNIYRTNPMQNNIDDLCPVPVGDGFMEDIPPDLDKIPLSSYHREIFEAKLRYLRDEYSLLQVARQKGMEEGRRLEKVDIARRLLERKKSLKMISEVTGLSKKEIIALVF